MCTGCTLTVSGGRVRVHPSRIFFGWKRNWKKKENKISDTPPENFRPDTPAENFKHPPKISHHTPSPPHPKISDSPPQNFRPHTPPRKFQTRQPPSPPENFRPDIPPAGTRPGTPPPRVDRQTPVNLLPWPNFVAAGKKRTSKIHGHEGKNLELTTTQ